jgi:hypothetical protein
VAQPQRRLDELMEKQTNFNLERAISGWRQKLTQSPAFKDDDLIELEVHLRDSIHQLQKKELSEEESFFVAARRLGQAGELEAEFGKENSVAVWVHRALWMLAGIQLAYTVLLISRILTGGLLLGWYAILPGQPDGEWLGTFVSIGGMLALIIAAWFAFFHRSNFIGKWISKFDRRPVLLGFVLVTAGVVLNALSFGVNVTLIKGHGRTLYNVWTAISITSLQVFVLPVALAWLLHKRKDVENVV